MLKQDIVIAINKELEVRPIAMLVQTASQFSSKIYIETGSKHVNAKSIMGMMTLGINDGEKITVSAEGEDEEAAIEQITNFLTGK